MLLSSFIHKSQKVQATQMSTNGWMDKQINSSYSGIFFSLKKGRKFWYMLQHRKTWRTLCEIKKASHKKTNIAWVHSYEAPRIVKYEDTESINIMVIARCYREEGKRGYFLTSSWRRQWQPTPVLLPGKSHGQRNLVGCSPWGHEESDTTERLNSHFSLSHIGEGNGNPLQCSCLENPRDGGAWWAAVYGVAQSRTRLKQLSSSSSREFQFYKTRRVLEMDGGWMAV